MSADLDLDAATPPIPRLCRYLSERSPLPLVAVEGTTHVVSYVNPAFARLIGRAAADLVGRPFAEAVPEGDGNGCLALLDRVFRTGNPENLTEQEHRQTPPAYWSYSMWAILGAGDRPVGVMVQVAEATEAATFRRQAVTMNEALMVSSVRQHELIDTIRQGEAARRDLEAELFQAQKMESLGVLAGGIAHDLNNMLTPVLGYTELAMESLSAGSPAAPLLEEVRTNTRRAADLVLQILAYAGKGRFVVQPLDLSGLVRGMNGLLSAAIPAGTDLAFDLPPDLPPVEGDATQLTQVVINLVRNAGEAIGGRVGRVTVRTGVVPADDPAVGSFPAESGPPRPFVFLEVADTGCGMTAEVLGKIFDPFYSTKFTGRGLGLAVVHGIARGHHSTLRVRSEPGRGSTFHLMLPAIKATAAPPPANPQAVTPAAWRASGTVLVVDDESEVRNLVAHILTLAGYTVMTAGDGEEGMQVFDAHRSGIDLVLLDLTMPRMSGLEVARDLRQTRPDLPVVLLSGFSADEVTRQSAGLAVAEFVQKPFTSTDLLTAVRRGLER